MKIYLIPFILLFLHFNVSRQEISQDIEIVNLANTKGSIILKVYTSSKAFDTNNPNFIKYIPKKENLNNGILYTQILLPKGTYGFAIVDDENNNRKMDFNVVGMPKEGFGFSNFYVSGLSIPKFSDFSFELMKKMGVIKIKLRYL